MDIYIKPAKKTRTHKTEIFLSDIAEVIPTDANVKIMDIHSREKASLLISVVDIVRALKRQYPLATVINLGESDTLIDYEPKKGRDNKFLRYLKIILVTVILFTGSSAAIMSFYTDAQMNRVFENMYYVITGQRTDNPLIIEIPYCFGLAAGIILFFNHVGGKKFDSDPTPMEIEISAYESDVTDTMISELSAKRSKERDGG